MNKRRRRIMSRALVTETLPYEVPVIFSNDKFYDLVSKFGSRPTKNASDLHKAVWKLIEPIKSYTVPFTYSIRKDDNRTTELSIVHPLLQLEFCKFYATHEGSMLSYCSRSAFSIRKPSAVASLYAVERLDPARATRGTPVETKNEEEELEDDESLAPSHLVSYFSYTKFNLLSKFYGSRDFLQLERRFRYMQSLDVSKCFYNLYTHSVSWAVKSKQFAKTNTKKYSFENRFDQLMQWANYNETNGIVVGPEFSRIFSEIVLQDVDRRVQSSLAKIGLIEGQHYSVRRYVDDYAIFALNLEHMKEVEREITEKLASIKLYVNQNKVRVYERPFVTNLTLARAELGIVMKEAEKFLDSDNPLSNYRSSKLRSLLFDSRTTVSKFQIGFGNISGWLVSTLKRMIDKTNSYARKVKGEVDSEQWSEVIDAILGLAFHICALDLRVRTTYSLCQLIKAALSVSDIVSPPAIEQIGFRINEELVSLVEVIRLNKSINASVELGNLLICGAHFLKGEFLHNTIIKMVLAEIAESKFSYFDFLTVNFCYLSDPVYFKDELEKLQRAVSVLIGDRNSVRTDSETFLFISDYLSSPGVDEKSKREMFDRLFGGRLSASTMASLSTMVGFSDWAGLSVEHLLERKQLRPVYAVA